MIDLVLKRSMPLTFSRSFKVKVRSLTLVDRYAIFMLMVVSCCPEFKYDVRFGLWSIIFIVVSSGSSELPEHMRPAALRCRRAAVVTLGFSRRYAATIAA